MAIHVNSISKRHGGTWVLRNVSFEIPDGSIVGIFGGSQSGKTSLAQILSGDVRSDGGNLSFDEAADRSERTIIKYVGSHRSPKLTDVVFRKNSLNAAGSAEIAALNDQLAAPCDLLILDDPFRRTDAEQLNEAIGQIRRFAAEHSVPVLFLTSSFDQLIKLADTAHFIDKTEIVQSGTPEDLYENPTSTLLATLTGDVNLIEARRLTKSTSDIHEFHSINGGHRLFADVSNRSRLGPINQNITLAIRPEQVVMSLGASFPEDNLLKAVVTEIEPRGATTLIHFDAEGLSLSTRVFRVVGLNVGDECMLGLPPHRIVVLGS